MDLLTAAFNVGHDFKGGARALAPQIGKNPNTLTSELSGVGTAKLGLQESLKMTLYTRDFRILDAFAAECGRGTFPLPDSLEPGEISSSLNALAGASHEFAMLCNTVCGSLSDNKVTDNELNAIESAMGHLIAAGQVVLSAVTACNLAGKPGAQPRGFAPFVAVSSPSTAAGHIGRAAA